MYAIVRTSQFKRDVKKALRRRKDPEKLKTVIRKLIAGKPLPAKYRDHRLKGNYRDCRECHIEGDWLLIYRVQGKELHLVRTGTHSDLFNE